jgi:hypothetical protein
VPDNTAFGSTTAIPLLYRKTIIKPPHPGETIKEPYLVPFVMSVSS